MSEQPPGSQDPQDPQDQQHPDVGSVAEEAAKLFGALSEWARDQSTDWADGVSGIAGQAAATARDVHDHLDANLQANLATGAPECRYCPVCRTVHVVRQLSPEVRAHLTTAASSLLQAAAGLMATQVPDQGARSTGVEHIDLDDDPDEPEAPR